MEPPTDKYFRSLLHSAAYRTKVREAEEQMIGKGKADLNKKKDLTMN